MENIEAQEAQKLRLSNLLKSNKKSEPNPELSLSFDAGRVTGFTENANQERTELADLLAAARIRRLGMVEGR